MNLYHSLQQIQILGKIFHLIVFGNKSKGEWPDRLYMEMSISLFVASRAKISVINVCRRFD